MLADEEGHLAPLEQLLRSQTAALRPHEPAMARAGAGGGQRTKSGRSRAATASEELGPPPLLPPSQRDGSVYSASQEYGLTSTSTPPPEPTARQAHGQRAGGLQ